MINMEIKCIIINPIDVLFDLLFVCTYSRIQLVIFQVSYYSHHMDRLSAVVGTWVLTATVANFLFQMYYFLSSLFFASC